jgi:DNA-binding beta-propeller fold protein YncE
MSLVRAVVAVVAVLAAGSGCRRDDRDVTEAQAADLANREQRLAARLANIAADSSPGAPLARWVLPLELREISGLAITAEGNLLAHNDEQARVFVIDPRRGVVTKQFDVGRSGLRGDFEGIAVSGADIYLLNSNGEILRFREGKDGDEVPYTELDTRLGNECEFEGIALDATSGLLLLPCKTVAKKGPRGQLVIYRWDPRRGSSQQASMLNIPIAQVAAGNPWRTLHPSDMAIDPVTRNYVLIAAQEKAFVEITPAGAVVRAGLLPEPSQQAEGVAITKDGVVIIADEGNDRAATLTLYRWPLTPEPFSGAPPPLTR